MDKEIKELVESFYKMHENYYKTFFDKIMNNKCDDNKLYKGIFWLTDLDDIGTIDLVFKIECDENGKINSLNLNSYSIGKSGNNFNHEKVWRTLTPDLQIIATLFKFTKCLIQ